MIDKPPSRDIVANGAKPSQSENQVNYHSLVAFIDRHMMSSRDTPPYHFLGDKRVYRETSI